MNSARESRGERRRHREREQESDRIRKTAREIKPTKCSDLPKLLSLTGFISKALQRMRGVTAGDAQAKRR